MVTTPGTISFDDAIRLHQQGNLPGAQALYERILATDSNHAGALHLLGVVRHQQGNDQAAADLIGRAIAICGTKAPYHSNYGLALHGLGRFAEARAALLRALQLRPDYAQALANLGIVEEALGNHDEAMTVLRRAVAIDPQHADVRIKLATLLEKLGQIDEAIGVYEDGIALEPCIEYLVNLGGLRIVTGQPDLATRLLRQAVAIDPNCPEAHFALGIALQWLCCMTEARAHFHRAAELNDPGNAAAPTRHPMASKPGRPLWGLRPYAVSPAVFQDNTEIDAYRNLVAERLAAFRAATPAEIGLDDIVLAGAFPDFMFSYHGRNNRQLKEAFAKIYEPYFRSGDPSNVLLTLRREAAPSTKPSPPAPLPEGEGTKRIGILVTEHHEAMFLGSMRGIVERLDAKRFEVLILCSRRIVEHLRKNLHRDGLTFVPFDRAFTEATQRIRDARCDLIYYWEVGSDALNYFLPFARLAPVQCTGWGSTITSGVPAIDYFLSSELIETNVGQVSNLPSECRNGDRLREGTPSPLAPLPEGEEKFKSQEQYTERLWLAKGLFAYKPRIQYIGPSSARAAFGLPHDRHLYVCFQNPLKLHPDFDPLLADILDRDPLALVVLMGGPRDQVTLLLKQRFARTIGAGVVAEAGRATEGGAAGGGQSHFRGTKIGTAPKIVFLPRQSFDDYCRLLQLADVILDPPHYGAGSSCYDIFSFNQPLVTLPGELIVGRVSQAFYCKMGVLDLIAASPADYVAKAVQVATDRDYRQCVKERIAAASDVVFNDLEAVREHERFFSEAMAAKATS